MQVERKDKLVQTIYFIDRLHKFVSTVVVILNSERFRLTV